MNIAYNKAKGRTAEQAVVDYLNARGFFVERRRLTGSSDCGDLSGLRGWVVSIKAEKRIDLPGYLDELAKQREAATQRLGGFHRGFVVVKKRGSLSPANWYAVMDFDRFVDLLQSKTGGDRGEV